MNINGEGARLSSIEAEALVSLAVSAVSDTEMHRLPDNIDCKRLYRLAKKNYITGIVYDGFCRALPNADGGCIDKWRNEVTKLAAYTVIQNRQSDELRTLLERNAMRFIGLKGYVIASLYPKNVVRACADIDICVQPFERKRIRKLLLENGYKAADKGANHDTYEKNGVAVEVHHHIHSETPLYCKYFEGIFERSQPVAEGRYELVAPPIDHAVFQTTHAMRHFMGGGMGIRVLSDHIAMRERLSVDKLELEAILDSLSVLRFYKTIDGICDKLIEGAPLTEDEAFFLEYMINSGVFGNELNNASMKHSEYSGSRAGTFKYIIGRMFLPFYDMSIRYTVLKKAPILLPFCYVHRWVKALFSYRPGLKSEINASRAVTHTDVEEKRRLKSIISGE